MPERFETNEVDSTTTSIFKTVGGDLDVNIARRVLRPEEQTVIESLPKGSALLIALSGPNFGARSLLNEDRTNTGRHQKPDIFLNDVMVLHKHVQSTRSGDEFSVRDPGPLNGTYVNCKRADAHALHTDDEAQIGKLHLTFYEAPATA